MTTNPYVNKAEMEQMFCVGGALEAITIVINDTNVPSMKENLQKSHDYLEKARDERWSYLADDQIKAKLLRRIHNSKIGMVQRGVDFSDSPCKITLNEDDLLDLMEQITIDHCYGCKGDKKNCKIYPKFRAICLPSNYVRSDDGKCEYRIDKIEDLQQQ